EVAVPDSSAALAVIQSGQVDADYTVVTVANLAQTQGLGQTALDLMKNGPSDFAAASLSGGAMRSEWLKGGSGDQEKRYHQAMVDAVDFLYKPENLDELVSLAKKNGVGGTDDQITSTLKLAIDAKAYSATVSKDDLSGALSFAQSAGVIAASPKIDLSTFATSTAVK
ncbi:MAG: hypothetical protein JWO98_5458, partial [Frankiales bacterium]|nr:hypothetical protein [Frankiales bacterium]